MLSPKLSFKNTKLILLDIDGVLTDGTKFINSNGEIVSVLCKEDRYAIEAAIDAGIKIIAITGGNGNDLREEFETLPLTHVFTRVIDKLEIVKEILKAYYLTEDEVMFIGDAYNDWAAMEYVGLRCCPNDADQEIRYISQYVTKANSGHGSVKEVIDLVIAA